MEEPIVSTRYHELWAHFRFGVVGSLLSAPPPRGMLASSLNELCLKTWKHPINREPTKFSFPTVERWYYDAKNNSSDPVGALHRKIRKDAGTHSSLSELLRRCLKDQYALHRSWSYQLHYDNLKVEVEKDSALGRLRSYSTIVRFMKRHGWTRRPRRSRPITEGVQHALDRLEQREVRSYEAEYVNALWHLDFHTCSKALRTTKGDYQKPVLLGILDDHSRLCCHLQWYWDEDAEHLIHGLCQAFHKRGLPRSLLTDNGSPMIAAETDSGLLRLGIEHPTTLTASPYQNGKQESYWGQVEGRLMEMLDNHHTLTLNQLNDFTIAWAEMEYNRSIHSEIRQTPLQRFLEGKDLSRPCPSVDDLQKHFCAEFRRTQRKSDGTLSLEGVRFELPGRYRHLERVFVRVARWDLSRAFLADERTGKILCPIYPLDKAKNADAKRRFISQEPDLTIDTHPERKSEAAPLLKKLLDDYLASGLPPAYLPKEE